MKLTRLLLLLSLAGITPPAARAAAPAAPFLPMKWERLPDMNIARAGHQVFVAGDDLVAVGGHAEGFVRTATAEYFADGAWHVLKTLYTNDNGFLVKLPDGDFLIGGGSSEDFGVGQTWGVQRYDPQLRSFSSFPILDIKRSLCSAAVLSSGRILVSGNWHAADAIGLSDGAGPFEVVQEVSQRRASPFIFPFGKDNAVVFGALTDLGGLQKPVVDRLGGEPYTPELFERWIPFSCLNAIRMDECRAVDPDTGREAFLFRAFDADGAQAILCFSEGAFSLLRTDCEIPLAGPWGAIDWGGNLLVDQRRGTALSQGWDAAGRAYLMSVDILPAFRGEEASLRIYYTDPLPERQAEGRSVLLADGRFVVVGGYVYADPMGNYNPLASVYAFSPFGSAEVSGMQQKYAKWPFVLLAVLALTAAALLLTRRRRPEEAGGDRTDPEPDVLAAPESGRQRELFGRIEALMAEKELFRQKGLGVADLATQLGTNTKYISSCINSEAGCPFNEYVNGYRIRYAQQLLRERPGRRLSDVADAAGFSGESSFYRNFKAVTGLTPAEWLAENS